MEKIKTEDNIVILSDHGFGKRPFYLINMNEVLRRERLLIINKKAEKLNTRLKQKFKSLVIKFLSKTHTLDIIASKLKKLPVLSKYKKSDFLIDKENSICYVDELFSGKKPYLGLKFGNRIKIEPIEIRRNYFNQISKILIRHKDLPKFKWIKLNVDLYKGEFAVKIPDICIELPKEYGVEFDMFGSIMTTRSTHYKLSGGHYGSSFFGFYSQNSIKKKITSVLDIYNFIISLYV